MQDKQLATIFRIAGDACYDMAAVLDGGGTGTASTPAEPSPIKGGPPASPADQARMKYLQSFMDNGGTLTLSQASAAAKAAGYGNPGGATKLGYVELVGGYHDPRKITPTGIAWLEA